MKGNEMKDLRKIENFETPADKQVNKFIRTQQSRLSMHFDLLTHALNVSQKNSKDLQTLKSIESYAIALQNITDAQISLITQIYMRNA